MILICEEFLKKILGQGLGFLRLMTLNFQAKKSFKHYGQCISFSYKDRCPFPLGKTLVLLDAYLSYYTAVFPVANTLRSYLVTAPWCIVKKPFKTQRTLVGHLASPCNKCLFWHSEPRLTRYTRLDQSEALEF